jgi:4-amino-4-deoxy-L-arabinose transferase-like glycosyltransferase
MSQPERRPLFLVVTQMRSYLPEFGLVLLVWMSFFAGLGEMDLWGRREQRVAAETVDTLRGNWSLAHLMGKPRLEKPPLARWLSAVSVRWTGQHNEWGLRLPYALGGAFTALVLYVWGYQLAGRIAGLAAVAVFCSLTHVIVELRQASADALLVPAVTLSLWTFWLAERRHQTEGNPTARQQLLRAASGLFAGFGFLAKGPVAWMLVLLSVAGYAWFCSRRRLVYLLLHPFWWAGAVLVALPWPLIVTQAVPWAPLRWMHEMGLKLGTVDQAETKRSLPFLLRFPDACFPWVPLSLGCWWLPFAIRKTSGSDKPSAGSLGCCWLLWSCVVLNLVVFSFFRVSKVPYYLPCLPAVALLSGVLWAFLIQRKTLGSQGFLDKLLLVSQGAIFLVGAVVAVPVLLVLKPQWWWLIAMVAACAIPLIALAVGRGSSADTPVWFGLAKGVVAAGVFLVYIPSQNPLFSHRELAALAEQLRQQSRSPVLAMPRAEEAFWFYMSQPPRPVPSYEAAIRVAHAHGGEALIIGDHRDLRALQAEEEIAQVETLFDQKWLQADNDLVLLRIRLQAPRLADRQLTHP